MDNRHIWYRNLIKPAAAASGLIIIYIFMFMLIMEFEGQAEHSNFYDAFYWVVTTITTVGYGDIVFISNTGKLFAMFVQLSGIPLMFGILFALIITPIIEKKIKPNVPSALPRGFNDHIIVCGYNKLIETLIEELDNKKIPYVFLEGDEDKVKELLKRNINAIYGAAYEETALKSANINDAQFLIANLSDEVNANVILAARNISNVDIIAIVENTSNKKYLKYAGATSVISPKEILGRFIGKKASDPFFNRLSGASSFFEGVSLVELSISQNCALIGKTIKNAELTKKSGANIVGIWENGSLKFVVSSDKVIDKNLVLLAVGSYEQLLRLKQILQPTKRKATDNGDENEHVIVLGCGDVGKWVVKTLKDEELRFTAADSHPSIFDDGEYEYFIGNVTDEEVLKKAGVVDASTVAVVMDEDVDVIFATLIARELNPDANIIARANSYGSIENIYRAGASYVAALPIVTGQMLVKMTLKCFERSCTKVEENILLYERIFIEKFTVTNDSELVNKTIGDIDLKNNIGCRVIGILRKEEVITDIVPLFVIKTDDVIAIAGTKQITETFKERYII